MRKARAGKGGYAITILVGVIAVLYFFPVLIAIVNSFKTKGEILTSAISFPSRPTFENYKTIIETALNSGNLSPEELVAQSNSIAEIIAILDEKEMRWLELSEI